jgi:hypothetical protein
MCHLLWCSAKSKRRKSYGGPLTQLFHGYFAKQFVWYFGLYNYVTLWSKVILEKRAVTRKYWCCVRYYKMLAAPLLVQNGQRLCLSLLKEEREIKASDWFPSNKTGRLNISAMKTRNRTQCWTSSRWELPGFSSWGGTHFFKNRMFKQTLTKKSLNIFVFRIEK